MPSSPLSSLLREGTKDLHRQAESTAFIHALFTAKLTKEQYRVFMLQLFHVYRALEEDSEDLRRHPVFGRVYFTELLRTEPLIKDLNFYYGSQNWRDITPTAATVEYVDRIGFLKRNNLIRLVAHHYTRYLGDLSGGQAMNKIVIKMLPDILENGREFYKFPQIEDFDEFKNNYRVRLDTLSIDEETAEDIVAEARYAFEMNKQLTESLMNAT
jgi:heme oxygenase